MKPAHLAGVTRGRCRPCRRLWEWTGKPRLRDARCPMCGKQLARTTYLLQIEPRRMEGAELLRRVAALDAARAGLDRILDSDKGPAR